MLVAGYYINGIATKLFVAIIDKNGDVPEFENEEKAKAYLKKNGYSDEKISRMVFKQSKEVDF